MLADLGSLVRQLALIALMASLGEMLLPNQKMAPYVRLMFGLFVLASCTASLGRILTRGEGLPLAGWDWSPPAMVREAFSPGSPSPEARERAWYLFRKRLGQQIRSLVLLSPEIREAEVEVVVDEKKGGSLLKVDIRVEVAEASPSQLARILARVKETVAGFYGLNPDNIRIEVAGR